MNTRAAAVLGATGSALGVLAGLTQATVGDRIPQWTGAKQAPVPLGLLTVVLSLLAALAAGRQRRAALSAGARALCALGLLIPGLLCLSTVGRLWYLPAALLITGAALTIEDWRSTLAAVAAARWRILLGALGACELLMAAGAAPVPMIVGALGGAALFAAAWRRSRTLLILGAIPFAAVAWTAVVPVVLAVEAFAVYPAVRVSRRSPRR